ncbi:MAG: hypothetical protein O3C57_03900 [Verrucomicrobia bacterium]|nr:hypothetical protein [Verrucomicrobiota bacterium]
MVSWRRRVFIGDRLEEAERFRDKWLTSDPARVADAQLLALQTRWAEATREIPFYRDLVARGEAPRSITSLEAFSREVPILTRASLVGEGHKFERDEPPHHILQTAGSTGEPLRFGVFENEEASHTGVQQWVARFCNGMTRDGKVFLLWGHSHLLGTGMRGYWKDRERHFKDWVMGYKRVNAYLVDPALSESYFNTMRQVRPEVVIGYSCALDMFARHCQSKGLKASDLGIKLCVACSENFPHPDSRQFISDWLGCPVLMEYGGVDFGVSAHELRNESGFRTFWWSHFVEVEGHGESGPLLVTNLTSRYLPLFRYRNGDECSGALRESTGHVSAFGAIEGRINDVLVMSNGPDIHSVGLFHCIHQEPVLSIQLVVKAEERRIRLVAPTLPYDVEKRIRKRLSDLHPDLGNYPMDVVPDVATNRAGKRRWIVYE